MNVGELKTMLSQYPDDAEVVIEVEYRQGVSETRTAFRDVFDHHGNVERTVLQLRHWNYGKELGMPHLDAAERERQRRAILDGLADARRPEKWANRRFTGVHGDFRIYNDYGGRDDTCYGTAYDRRVFAELETEGLILRKDEWSGTSYSITDAGFAAAATKEPSR